MDTPDFEHGRVYFKRFGAQRVKVFGMTRPGIEPATNHTNADVILLHHRGRFQEEHAIHPRQLSNNLIQANPHTYEPCVITGTSWHFSTVYRFRYSCQIYTTNISQFVQFF